MRAHSACGKAISDVSAVNLLMNLTLRVKHMAHATFIGDCTGHAKLLSSFG